MTAAVSAEPPTLSRYIRMLKRMGYAPECADNGRAAMPQLTATRLTT
jgi:hypothetical protein